MKQCAFFRKSRILSEGKGIVKAILCYTCDADKPYAERNWESKPAEVVTWIPANA